MVGEGDKGRRVMRVVQRVILVWETHPSMERSRTVGREFESLTKDEEVLFYWYFILNASMIVRPMIHP